MAVIVEQDCVLDAAPERVFEVVTSPRGLRHVAWPLIRFVTVDPPEWPDRFAGGAHLVALRLFGIVPLGRQVIDVSFPEGPAGGFAVRDNGHSALIARWDHWVTIAPHGADQSHYTDRVTVEAGWRTPVAAAFARVFYAHRQRRLRRLMAKG